jgi:hypothetical protein
MRHWLFVFALGVLLVSITNAARADIPTLSGSVTVVFHFLPQGDPEGRWYYDHTDGSLALTVPAVIDIAIKPEVIGPGTLDWTDKNNWTQPLLDTTGVSIGQAGSGTYTATINAGSATLDVLQSAGLSGPSETDVFRSNVRITQARGGGDSVDNSAEVDSNFTSTKFNVTIPTGAHVSQNTGGFSSTVENLAVASGASLDMASTAHVRHTFTNHGSGTFDGVVDGDFVTDAFSASGNVAKIDSLDVQGQLQNTGELQLLGGTLRLRSTTSNAGSISATSSALIQVDVAFTNSGTISLTGSTSSLSGAGTVTNNGSLQWSAGSINAALVNNSDMTITGSNGYVANGSVANHGTITQSTTVAPSYSGGLTNAAGALYDITNDGGVTGTAITNMGTFRKSGSTGTSNVGASFTNSGTIAINSGILSFNNTLTLDATSKLQFQLRGVTPSTDFGNLYNFTPAFAGALNVTLGPGFAPSLGNSFDLLDWSASTISGTFASLQLPPLASGLKWNTSSLYTTGALSVAAGLPGDYDQNGVVDPRD